MRKKDLLKELISKIIDASDDLGLDVNLKINNLITEGDKATELLRSIAKIPEGKKALEEISNKLKN